MENNKIKVLAIDDNPDNLISLKALVREAFPVALFFSATSGIHGLELAATENPDVILLDIVMPEMDGFEVCKKLKSDKILCDIPVVFVTALKGDKLSRLHALEVGAEAFLAKPLDEYELTAQIRAMVKIKSANTEKRDRVKLLSKLVDQRTYELNQANKLTINLLEDIKKENEARKKSEETYRMLFESISDAVFISEKASDGAVSRFIRVNKVACERLGYTEQELLAKTSFEINSEHMKPLLPDLLKGLFENKSAIIETEHVAKDGRIIPVEISTNIFQLDNKTIFHSIARDITERKKADSLLKESENKYRSLVETAQELVWKCNANAQFTYLNPSWEKTHGYKIEEMLGKSFAEFQRPEIFERDIIEFTRHMAGGSVKEYETNHITKDGRELTLLFNAIPLMDVDGNVIGTQGTAYDITDRKKAEDALKDSEQNLIRGELTASFGYWNSKLGDRLFYASIGAQEIYGVDKSVISHVELKNQRLPEYSAMIDEAFGTLVKDGKPIDIEYKIRRFNDGKIIDIHSKVEFNPETKNFFGVIQDITNRKQAEEALKESEFFFKESQGAASIGSYKLDFATGFWKSSEILDQIFGIDQNFNRTVEGWLDLVFPEDREMMSQHFAEDVISKHNTFDKEYRISSKADGTVRWVHGLGKLSIDNNGKIRAMAGTIQDITERKKSEEDLKESNAKYQFIVENSEDILWSMNPDFIFDYVSPSVYKFLGYTVEEHKKQSLEDFLTPESVKLITDEFRIGMMNLQKKEYHKLRNEASFEIRVIRKDKTIRNSIISLKMIRDENYRITKIRGMTSDITQRKQADVKIRKSELQYRMLAENVNDVIWVVDPGTARFLYISPSVEFVLGYTPEEMMQMQFSDTLQPEIRGPFLKEMKERINKFLLMPETPIRYRHETVHLHKNGTLLYAEISNHYYLNKITGKLEIQGVSRDITERKLAETKLRESELRYRLLAENVKDIIWVLDPSTGHFVYISPSVETELGYSPEEMMQMPFSATLLPEIRERFMREVKERMDFFYANPLSTTAYRHEVVHLHKNGTLIYAEITNHYYLNKTTGKLEIQGVSRDITERKKREKAQSFSNEILRILNSNLSLKDMIDGVLHSIREEMKYSAVGMRIKIGDDFPYFAENGFSKSFLLKENSLIARDSQGKLCKDEKGNPKLECSCGLVVSGKTDPASPMFTNAGSFWTNNSYPLLELTPEQEPRFQPRNTCIHLGYGSVAIIPIRANGIIIGTLQLNDKKENAFTIETIHFFESICLNIGNTLMRNLEREKRKVAEQDLKDQAVELVSRNTQLTDFCNIISHNLRGPLVNISMLIDFVEQSKNEEEKNEILGKFKPVINSLNENFSELIESLQVKNDVSIKSEKINVKECFQSIFDGLQIEINKYEASIEMDFNDAPIINFPQKYLKSILYNLLSNSLKYKSPKRKPIIKVKTEKIEEFVVLSFTDNGLGIDLKRHKNNLFKIRRVFHDHPDAKGFGLFITKTQVEAMGGKISVESIPDEGTTFFIEFKNQNA